MTIIVFLVDTSASMNQRAFVNGRKTLLDISKEAVEVFVKQRQKSADSRGDRYMLLTFDEFPRNIKAGWKENLATFMAELKNLEASGMSTLGSALKAVFDTLNINRMQSGIDMYGQGRYPYYLEPAVIVVVTDGGKLTTATTVQRELNLPMTAGAGMGGMSGVPGAELTREPFRWDQRLYALVLRMAGHPPMSGAAAIGESGHVASDNSPVDAMCEVTGGRSYAVTSNRVLHQCIESLVQKLQSGVVIHFEKTGSDPPLLSFSGEEESLLLEGSLLPSVDQLKHPDSELKSVMLRGEAVGPGSRPHTPNPVIPAVGNTAWHSCRKLIYVQRSAQKGFAVGFWPLPESFWPDVNAGALPPRSAHPTLKFTCMNQEPMIIDNLPFDKYELEPSPLTLFILGRKQPNYCWQVFIQGSTKTGDTGHPFGYLKASTNLLTVNLFVLPYNYPMLLPLLDELFKQHRLKPTNDWRNQFHNYLRTMPSYYAVPLRRALTRMGAGNLAASLIPESMDNSLSYSVLNYLKRLKNQAKQEYDRIVSITPYKGKAVPDGIKVVARSPLKRELVESPGYRETASPMLRDQLTDFPGYMLGLPEKRAAESHPLRNPFDISRSALLDQVVRMRANLLCGRGGVSHLVDEDTRHSLPIGQMGNYQDYLKKQPMPLRELESAPVRQHMFGNPFKTNKNLMMMTDEVSGLGGVDEVQIINASGGQTPPGTPGAGGAGLPVLSRGLKRPAEQLLAAPPKRRKGPLPRDFQLRSPRESPSPAHQPESDFGGFLNSGPPAIPLVNGLKTTGAGKMAGGAIEIDLESEDSAAEDFPAGAGAVLILEEPPTAPGSKLVNVNHRLPEAARNHFNKNNNKTDFQRRDAQAVKPLGVVELPVVNMSSINMEATVPAGMPTEVQQLYGGAAAAQCADGLMASQQQAVAWPQQQAAGWQQQQQPTVAWQQQPLGAWQQQAANSAWQPQQGTPWQPAPQGAGWHPQQGPSWQPNGQLEKPNQQPAVTTPATAASSALQLRARLEPTTNALFSKDVIGEILNLPPAEPPLPPPPPPILPQVLPPASGSESSPEAAAVLGEQIPGRRTKKLVSAPAAKWETVTGAGAVSAAPPAPSDPEVVETVTEEELRSFRLRNNNVRQLIYKEVKRPGRCHAHLWQMLEGLHGPPWVRKQFIYEVKQEALRFKRSDLADQLQTRCDHL